MRSFVAMVGDTNTVRLGESEGWRCAQFEDWGCRGEELDNLVIIIDVPMHFRCSGLGRVLADDGLALIIVEKSRGFEQ
jgi:hypothetical protein